MNAESRITWWSVWVNLGLGAAKAGIGAWGGSQALLADGVHSLSDLASDVAVLAGLRAARRPGDEDHAYGHGKYETLAAAGIGLLLAGVAAHIGWEAIGRIAGAIRGAWEGGPSALAFWAAVAGIAVKEGLYQATMRVARATGSSALAANAWHHRSDAFSSMATGAGIGAAVFLGKEWAVLDPIAALFVAVILLRVAWGILREQWGGLTDEALPPGVQAEILTMANSTEGVADPHHLRTRMVGRHAVIELHIRLDPEMPLREAHEIASHLERALKRRFGEETIVTLHLEPWAESARQAPVS